ncbi:MAG TPA: hypothetical protein VIJ11_03355 [Galbitalea sp.]
MIRALISIAGLLLAVLVVLFLISLTAPGLPLQLAKGFFGFVGSFLGAL